MHDCPMVVCTMCSIFGAGGGIRTHAGLRQRILSAALLTWLECPPPLSWLGHPRKSNYECLGYLSLN